MNSPSPALCPRCGAELPRAEIRTFGGDLVREIGTAECPCQSGPAVQPSSSGPSPWPQPPFEIEGLAYEPGWIVDDPVTVLDGELLAPGVASGPCAFEQWYADGWYRWRCTAPDHQGTGEDRTETGRAAALRRHAEYVERERAAGAMTGYVPVIAEE